jgi:hypothetical protein
MPNGLNGKNAQMAKSPNECPNAPNPQKTTSPNAQMPKDPNGQMPK